MKWIIVSLIILFPTNTIAGTVFKDLSTTQANQINRSILELHYLRVNSKVWDQILLLTAKIRESKIQTEIQKLDKEKKLNQCVIVLTSEFIWHFDKENQMLEKESSLIQDGLEMQKSLKKDNFDCSLYEEEVGNLFNNYEKNIY
jgi:hypothetical protein